MQRRLMANSDGASATSTNTASAASASAMKRKKKGWLELRSFRGNFRRLWVVLRNDILVLAKTESVRALYRWCRLWAHFDAHLRRPVCVTPMWVIDTACLDG